MIVCSGIPIIILYLTCICYLNALYNICYAINKTLTKTLRSHVCSWCHGVSWYQCEYYIPRFVVVALWMAMQIGSLHWISSKTMHNTMTRLWLLFHNAHCARRYSIIMLFLAVVYKMWTRLAKLVNVWKKRLACLTKYNIF